MVSTHLGVDGSSTSVVTDLALSGGGVRSLRLALEELVLVRVRSVVVRLSRELVLEIGELDGGENGRLVHDGSLVNLLVDGDDVVNLGVLVGLSLDDGGDLEKREWRKSGT